MPKRSTGEGAGKSSAPALTRGLRVLELLARSDRALSLSAIYKALGIPLSSAHAICATLMSEGYVERRSDGTFDLSLKVLDLASSKISRYDIVEHFYEVCDETPIIREHAAVISVLDGPDVLYIGSRTSPEPLGITFRIGMRLPACCTASGRAMLATMTDEEVKALYPEESLPQVTKLSTPTRTELLDILAQARQQGYATEKGGTRPHMYSYGAAIGGHGGRNTAVAVMLYEGDVTPERELSVVDAVRELARRLSRVSDIAS